jgi:hypothetical protein
MINLFLYGLGSSCERRQWIGFRKMGTLVVVHDAETFILVCAAGMLLLHIIAVRVDLPTNIHEWFYLTSLII